MLIHRTPQIMCSGRALRPAISTYKRGTAEAIIRAMIAPVALYDNQNTAIGAMTAAATMRAVTPDASGQSKSAVAVMRNKRGVGLGIDAVEEPIFIQIYGALNLLTLPQLYCRPRLPGRMPRTVVQICRASPSFSSRAKNR